MADGARREAAAGTAGDTGARAAPALGLPWVCADRRRSLAAIAGTGGNAGSDDDGAICSGASRGEEA